MTMRPRRRIAILGAGPIGLEAALYARSLGHVVNVYETDRQIAGHVRAWGHVRLFTAWPLNVSSLASRRLRQANLAAAEWPASKCPTGSELIEQYLEPICRLPEMQGVVQTGVRVLGVGRAGLLKGEAIAATGDGRRAGRPFLLLLRRRPVGTVESASDPGSEEEFYQEADVVLDATGVYGQPNPLGRSGLPVPGEGAASDALIRGLPNLAGFDRERVSQRDVLVVGGGLSAATTITALEQVPTRSVWWMTRSPAPPIAEVPDDPLPARLELTRRANALAADSRGPVRHLGGCEVRSLSRRGSRWVVQIGPSDGASSAGGPAAESSGVDLPRLVEVDTVIVQTGFRPDNSIYRELQFHECYASQGPMKLSAALLGASGGDCMTQTGHGPESLTSPEPDFFLIGGKSYGRGSQFLLRIGREQIVDVFRLIEGDPTLELR